MDRIENLKQALSVSPDNAPLLLVLGEAALEELQLDEAQQAFEKLLQFDSHRAEAQFGLARYMHLSGKISEAIVRMESLVQSHPNQAKFHHFLSRLLLMENQKDVAREYYKKARQLNAQLRDEALEKALSVHEEAIPPVISKIAQSIAAEDELDDVDLPTEMETPKIDFSHVGGMETVKEEIRMKILYPLKNPALFKAYGKTAGGGVLLYGPPGCGKTLISRATAGEIHANFLSIGIHQILDMWIGNSEKNLHQLFELARDNAPTILFFDEVDALAADRVDLKRSAGKTLINQFLAEMDGSQASNEGVLVLGATNAPWHIDPAFRRPGRFDRILFVPPPDEVARQSIIEVLAQGKPIEDLDAKALAKKTKDFSGADLKSVFDVAIERSLARAMKENRLVPLSTKDLLETVKTIKPSTKAWFESAKNYALYSNQSGFYDDVLTFLGIKK
ncbi:MAG: AAA family ATPase [Verrucomicrobiia bacterium]